MTVLVDNVWGCLGLTILSFAVGTWLYERSGRMVILQPFLVAIISMSVLLRVTGVPYERYLERTFALHSLLGPAIVALALPLYDNLRRARSVMPAVVTTLVVGGMLVTGSALAIGLAFGLDRPMELSLTTKSVTAPIALAVAEKIGGTVSLTILSVFTSGILGVLITPGLLHLAGVRSLMVRGFTLGMTSHAFGIARAIELGPEAVAFATLGMALMGCATAILVPALFRLG